MYINKKKCIFVHFLLQSFIIINDDYCKKLNDTQFSIKIYI